MASTTANLEQRLLPMRESKRFSDALLARFAGWISSATDEELFRVTPLRWAEANGITAHESIDLFVHAAKAGIFDFAWGFLCRDCGAFIHTKNGLKSLQRAKDCRL